MQFAENPNCVSDLFSDILNSIENYQRSLAWASLELNPAM